MENPMTEVQQLTNRLYTAHATATGGRTGHTQNADGVVSFDLAIPKGMGGTAKAGATTPEDLFAAGYAACFGSACDFAANSVLKVNPSSIEVHSAVTIGQTPQGGFGLEVKLQVDVGGLNQADAQKLVETAHQICPYSNAIRNNVRVELEVRAI
jgi:lipoyl-dependent peroxiredoxin